MVGNIVQKRCRVRIGGAAGAAQYNTDHIHLTAVCTGHQRVQRVCGETGLSGKHRAVQIFGRLVCTDHAVMVIHHQLIFVLVCGRDRVADSSGNLPELVVFQRGLGDERHIMGEV